MFQTRMMFVLAGRNIGDFCNMTKTRSLTPHKTEVNARILKANTWYEPEHGAAKPPSHIYLRLLSMIWLTTAIGQSLISGTLKWYIHKEKKGIGIRLPWYRQAKSRTRQRRSHWSFDLLFLFFFLNTRVTTFDAGVASVFVHQVVYGIESRRAQSVHHPIQQRGGYKKTHQRGRNSICGCQQLLKSWHVPSRQT